MSKVLSVNIQNIRGIFNLKINLSLSPDVYAITGVNGIGKSTLLTCITPRLHRPTSFEVLKSIATNESSIEYTIGDETEIWKYDGSQ